MRKLILVTLLLVLLMGQVANAQDDDLALLNYGMDNLNSPSGLDAFNNLVERQPDFAEAYYGRTLWWLSNGDDLFAPVNYLENALADIEMAKSLSAEADLALLQLEANIYLELGNLEAAETVYLEMIDLSSYDNFYVWLLLQLYDEQNRPEDALALIRQGRAANPVYPLYITWEKNLHERLGNAEHLTYFSAILRAMDVNDPDNPDEALDILENAVSQAREAGVIDNFDIALSYVWMYRFLVDEASHMGTPSYSSEIRETVDTMLELSPDWHYAYFLEIEISIDEGVMHEGRGVEEGIEKVNVAIERFPHIKEFYMQRGKLYALLDDFDEASINYWIYAQMYSRHVIDFSRFDILNKPQMISMMSGGEVRFSFEAEAGDEFRFSLGESSYLSVDHMAVLLDAEGNLVDRDMFFIGSFSTETLELNKIIPADGVYTFALVHLSNSRSNDLEIILQLD